MMFSMCHCWSRTSQERGGSSQYQSSSRATTRNTRWKQFETAQSMQKSQNWATYQASTIWCLGKGIQKKKIPGSQPQRSSILGSSSAHSTRTTLTSRRRLLLQSTPHHQWLGQQSSPLNLSSGNKDDRQDALQSALRRARCAKQGQERGDKEEATRRNPSQCSSKS